MKRAVRWLCGQIAPGGRGGAPRESRARRVGLAGAQRCFPDPGVAPRAARLDIDPKEFTVSRDVEVVDDFAAMGLKEDLLRGVYAYGACRARAAAALGPAPPR